MREAVMSKLLDTLYGLWNLLAIHRWHNAMDNEMWTGLSLVSKTMRSMKLVSFSYLSITQSFKIVRVQHLDDVIVSIENNLSNFCICRRSLHTEILKCSGRDTQHFSCLWRSQPLIPENSCVSFHVVLFFPLHTYSFYFLNNFDIAIPFCLIITDQQIFFQCATPLN